MYPIIFVVHYDKLNNVVLDVELSEKQAIRDVVMYAGDESDEHLVVLVDLAESRYAPLDQYELSDSQQFEIMSFFRDYAWHPEVQLFTLAICEDNVTQLQKSIAFILAHQTNMLAKSHSLGGI